MTIWKAIGILFRKVSNAVTPCSHEWNDEGAFYETTYGLTTGRKMVQRCSHCQKYRRLKIY